MSPVNLSKAVPSFVRYATTSAYSGKHKVVVIGGGE